MTIAASAIWRIRTGGSDLNGGGYDGASYGGGVDYSQQDAAQASWSNLAMAGTTTLTDSSATGAFTSAMVGNAINVNSQFYFVTAFTDSNNVVVDRSDTFSGKSGKLGGGLLTIPAIADNSNATGAKCVAGNKIYLRASGAGSTSAPDYTIGSGGSTGRLTTVAGTTSAGLVQFLAENGMPYVKLNVDIPFISCFYNHFNGSYLFFPPSASTLGMFHACDNISLIGCVLDLNGNAAGGLGTAGAPVGACDVIGCEIKGGVSAALSGQAAINQNGNGGFYLCNYIHDIGDVGINVVGNGWMTASYNLIRNAWGAAMSVTPAAAPNTIANNTLDNGKSHGIVIGNQAAVSCLNIVNNLITNFTGTSKYGITVTDGATATSDRLKSLIDYNLLYNCAGLYQNISAGAHDLNSDPKYVNQSTGDYRLQSGSPARAAGYSPSLLNAVNGNNYLDLGALQHQDAGGGGGLFGNSFSGGML